jgi:hypothetical protein
MTPDFDEIFTRRPELQPPGYKEAVQAFDEKRLLNAPDPIKERLQLVQKEKIAARNRQRNKNRRRN